MHVQICQLNKIIIFPQLLPGINAWLAVCVLLDSSSGIFLILVHRHFQGNVEEAESDIICKCFLQTCTHFPLELKPLLVRLDKIQISCRLSRPVSHIPYTQRPRPSDDTFRRRFLQVSQGNVQIERVAEWHPLILVHRKVLCT